MALTTLQQEILEFERRWPKHNAAKLTAIREFFAMPAIEYERLLEALLGLPAARAYDEELVRTVARHRKALKWFNDRPECDWR